MATSHLGPVPDHADAGRQSETIDGLSEKSRPAGRAVEQHGDRVGPQTGQHQPGHPSAAAEVDEGGRLLGKSGGEALGVADVRLDGAWPEEAPAVGLPQERVESEWDQLLAVGAITTRRRGSSPSDAVMTPSMSLAVSWITLRSAGCIGSRTFREPVARTSSAT